MATAGRAPATTALPHPAGHADTLARIAAVRRRLRVARAIAALPSALAITAVMAAAGLCALKLGEWTPALWLLALACVPVPAATLGAALRRTSPLVAARLLDAQLGDKDLLASAWSFGEVAPDARTPFMRACIDSAARRAQAADPVEALPYRRPRGLFEALPAVLGVGLLAALEVPVRVAMPMPEQPRPRLLQQDDIAAFAQEVTPLASDAELDPELRETAAELNALLEALEQGELERAEALRELRRLEAELAAALDEARDEALREALSELGSQLGKEKPHGELAEALRDGDAQRAREAMNQLAKELEGLSKPQQRALEKALERAAKQPEAREQALERARREVERLLRKKQKEGEKLAERDKRLLRKKQRELDRLRREHQARAEAQRKLDRLRRHLDGAAGQMGQASGSGASQELSQGAESLQELARQQLSQEQRKRLQQQLEQLRQLMSKQGGQQQQNRAGQDGREGGKQGRPLGLEGFARAAQGQGQGKDGQKDGKDGQGKGDEQRMMLLQPGGQGGQPAGVLQLPGAEQRSGAGAELAGGREAGEGGRSASGAETRLAEAEHQDTQVTGQKGGGPTRSEVIREAGSRGFAARSYEHVHGEYEKHAESVLERDEVPGGYRFYVRRYFQLIRPREGDR